MSTLHGVNSHGDFIYIEYGQHSMMAWVNGYDSPLFQFGRLDKLINTVSFGDRDDVIVGYCDGTRLRYGADGQAVHDYAGTIDAAVALTVAEHEK